jgi:radical SAM superfamily enzyme YgiQ (UPF0313 family)
MKVCLIRPPSIVSATSYVASLTPPLGVTYLAAALRAAGHEPVIIDAIGEDPLHSVQIDANLVLRGISFDEIVKRIPKDTGLIGFSGMFSSEWTHYKKLIDLIGATHPDPVFIAGGEHFTAAPELSMTQCPSLDAVVKGEGEETIVDIANRIAAGASWREANGVVSRDGDGYKSSPPRARLRKLDDIKTPAWDLVPLENYLSNLLSYGVNRGRSMPMLASRGCPYQCTFCSNPEMWGTRWVARSPKLVVDEIEDYIKRYNISNVDFYDLTAIVKRGWIIEFCHELINRKLNITWQLPSGTRSEAIDQEVCKLLYASGCRNMNYAPESGDDETLAKIKKKVKLDRLTDSLHAAISEGLNVKINIIIGFPHETHRHILKTVWFLTKMTWAGAHDVSVGVFAPYPGSELYEDLVKSGRITHDDVFWNKLAYVDITDTISYCPQVSQKWLVFYNWLAFAVFYGTNYLFRPMRFIRTIRNLITNQHESRGEMALAQIFQRFRFMSLR